MVVDRAPAGLKTLDELLFVGIASGVLYLVFRYLVGTFGVAVGCAAVFLGGVLVGAYLRPWAARTI